MQGPHQVAQKSTTTIFPEKSFRFTESFFMPRPDSSGLSPTPTPAALARNDARQSVRRPNDVTRIMMWRRMLCPFALHETNPPKKGDQQGCVNRWRRWSQEEM